MYQGKHVLIVFDDLTKQAEAYRAISLLLRRPPGREAYPGDVFYLHSRLLERCAKLSDELGGGSLTGLPIIETKANDISAYIPTNVISITDGQCFLETDLFNQGVRPAINVGVVGVPGRWRRADQGDEGGGRARCGWTCRSTASWRRSRRSPPTWTRPRRPQLDRGARLVELLKQPQYSPMPVEEQVVSIFLGTSGHLDSVPVEDVSRFETRVPRPRAAHGTTASSTRSGTPGKLPEETERAGSSRSINEFKKGFATLRRQSRSCRDEPVDAHGRRRGRARNR